ncbi:uncharacterized protein BJ171DRAFT_503289 [Polychytrium aggregatum]|uniref:uncharacterized protein n=1 Tax=Polychytrium aggregatum TaxID=110093 RepID=UPI0022FE61A4|nr:uncharacterized protein BJ171DRAFT_503289 [Polychytrium aggregatum]KAI9205216.1 hypothetical protein BJ171DRAFT_503289 [Polychytrium aggregatum]
MGQRTKARRSMIVIVIFGFCEWNICCCPTAWGANSTIRTSRIYGPGFPPKPSPPKPSPPKPTRQYPPARITPIGCAHPAMGPGPAPT